MKNVLLTGAKGNVGVTVTKVLADQGWNVIPVDKEDGDLGDPNDVSAIVTRATQPLSAVVHLVGGIAAGKPIEDIDLDDVHNMFTLNVVTTFNLMKAAIPLMKDSGGGSFVTIGAQSVLHPVADRAAYSAAKSAVVSLTQALAEEGRPHNIRANSILPSIIKTPANMEWASEEEAEKWPTREQIANAIADLIHPNSGVSGAVIPMFGKVPF